MKSGKKKTNKKKRHGHKNKIKNKKEKTQRFENMTIKTFFFLYIILTVLEIK